MQLLFDLVHIFSFFFFFFFFFLFCFWTAPPTLKFDSGSHIGCTIEMGFEGRT